MLQCNLATVLPRITSTNGGSWHSSMEEKVTENEDMDKERQRKEALKDLEGRRSLIFVHIRDIRVGLSFVVFLVIL